MWAFPVKDALTIPDPHADIEPGEFNLGTVQGSSCISSVNCSKGFGLLFSCMLRIRDIMGVVKTASCGGSLGEAPGPRNLPTKHQISGALYDRLD